MRTFFGARQKSIAHALVGMSVLALSGCVGIFGETIPVTHDELTAPARHAAGDLSLTQRADDRRSDTSRVGRATITVFAITSGNVVTETPLVEEVVRNVKEALEVAGYNVKVVSQGVADSATPVAKVEISRFYFRNYNWVWPIVPTWGDVAFELKVADAEQHVVYERSFSGSGTSFCLLGHCAFKAATRRAMTKALNELVAASASDEFRRAIGGAM